MAVPLGVPAACAALAIAPGLGHTSASIWERIQCAPFCAGDVAERLKAAVC